MDNNIISINKISKTFNNKTILDDITLNIHKGEILGLLGPSGAGKTTLIKIITGQLKPDLGTVYVLGLDVNNFPRNIYTKFGMVLDDSGLYKRLSCYSNLKIFADIFQISQKRIKAVLNYVGLENDKKTSVNKMSKGMKQRLVFARALLNNPLILFLDEPTSGLDPTTTKKIHKLILEEKNKGTTIFLTTHNMEEATKLCDNVALLNSGKIIEYGKPQDICRKYNYNNQIVVSTKNHQTLIYSNESNSAKDIYQLLLDDNIESIHSTEPNLEAVFLELTGRNIENESS